MYSMLCLVGSPSLGHGHSCFVVLTIGENSLAISLSETPASITEGRHSLGWFFSGDGSVEEGSSEQTADGAKDRNFVRKPRISLESY